MYNIYKFKPNQPVNWFHKDKQKSNRHCLYCSCDLLDADIKSNAEHLIARNFVPEQSWGNGQAFNFIFRACVECNDEKAELERHVSAISLVNSPARHHDVNANESAKRKAEGDFHPDKRGTLVNDSVELHKATYPFMGIGTVSVGTISPPQLKKNYAYHLATCHIQGLFSLITSENPLETTKQRFLPPNQCKMGIYGETDWGNPQLMEVISRVKNWNPRANIVTANGYFKAILKGDDQNNSGWFWALEWNKCYRVVGVISASESTPEIFKNLPKLSWARVSKTERIRQEIRLDPKSDTLFQSNVPEAETI